jgi:hypothetical protein
MHALDFGELVVIAAERFGSGNLRESNSYGREHIQVFRKSSEMNLKKLTLVAGLFLVFGLFDTTAYGQQIDAAFGFGTLTSAAGETSGGLFFPTMGGGLYPSFSGDFLFTHRLGIEGDIAWRASQNSYGGSQPYRPIFYAVNAIWAPKLAKPITAELLAGIGGESLRFYTPYLTCGYVGCTDYFSSNHFMGDFGAGIRAYFWHNAFIRPEVRLYLINNNNEFSSGVATRYSISLGYSFGGR